MIEKIKITKAEVSAILFEVDPMGLNYAPADEYDSEAELIVNELASCTSLEEIYELLVKIFIQMFDRASVAGKPSQRLHLAAKILFDREIFEYVLASIKGRKEMEWYVTRLTRQVEEKGQPVPFPKPDNYNEGIEAAASLVQHNPRLFDGEDANKRAAEEIRKLKE